MQPPAGRRRNRAALVVAADPGPAHALAQRLAAAGFATRRAETAEKAAAELAAPACDLVVADLSLLDHTGRERFERLTAAGSPVTGVTAEGRLLRDDAPPEPRLARLGPLLGSSLPMQAVYTGLLRVAPTAATVFLAGESGTGKELAAQLLHDLSHRADGPYAPLNCGALAPELVESELFGHEKGSFTGASRRHAGLFERAHGGTVFLDEITEMPTALQVRLLRALEEGRVQRVGGDAPVDVDVRVIAATNRDPERAVADGALRRDLYYRLCVFPLPLPPLRERSGDVATIAAHTLAALSADAGLERPRRLTAEALALLEAHPWPGNVRELCNAVERAFILADDEAIGPACFDLEAQGSEVAETPRPPLRPSTVEDRSDAASPDTIEVRVGMSVAEVERRLITAELARTDGNKTEAARRLGISVKTLYNRLTVYRAAERGRRASA